MPVLAGAVAYLVMFAILFLVLFVIIKVAVRSALDEHYKTVRWYERTGEWKGNRAPRAFDDAAVVSD